MCVQCRLQRRPRDLQIGACAVTRARRRRISKRQRTCLTFMNLIEDLTEL